MCKRKQRRAKRQQREQYACHQKDKAASELEDYTRLTHSFLHHSWLMYDMQYGISLDDLCQVIDPIRHYRTMMACSSDALMGKNSPITCLSGTTTRGIAGVAMALFQHDDSLTDEEIRVAKYRKIKDRLEHYSLKVTGNVPVVLDTGASYSLTPILEDFVTELSPAPISEIRGVTATAQVVGQGLVEWPIRDIFGRVGVIRTMAYYVPDAHIRLFSPQVYFQEHKDQGECIVQGKRTILHTPDGSSLEFPYHACSNLPLMLMDWVPEGGVNSANIECLGSTQAMSSLLSVADQTNQNLSPAQRELIAWHWKLGHSHFDWNQALMRRKRTGPDAGKDPPIKSRRRGVSNCPISDMFCTACQMAKQGRRLGNQRGHSSGDPILRANALNPGDKVSTDQYISALGGRLPHTKGKEPKKNKYNGGTIFCDHATQYISLTHQVSLRAGETIQSKRRFEREATQFGVKVKSYRADNHPFGSNEFRAELDSHGQDIDFSGVGAHHQNAVAERSIQTVTWWARAMLLHAVIMWPDAADLELWPFALSHAVYLWNNLPRKDHGLSPV